MRLGVYLVNFTLPQPFQIVQSANVGASPLILQLLHCDCKDEIDSVVVVLSTLACHHDWEV